MIGFKLTATSNTSYKRNYSSWTEGSMWLVKAFEITRGLTNVAGVAQDQAFSAIIPGPTDLIEPAFRQLLSGYLKRLAGVENKISFGLTGKGNTYNTYYFFDANTSGTAMLPNFMQRLRWASDAYKIELGTEIMIHICKTISDFDDYLTISMPDVEFGVLNVEIEF